MISNLSGKGDSVVVAFYKIFVIGFIKMIEMFSKLKSLDEIQFGSSTSVLFFGCWPISQAEKKITVVQAEQLTK